MEQIKKMIEAYNKKAQKWGFQKIEIVNGKISNEFSVKTTNSKNFFSKIKTTYQNGYMKEDYDKIKNALLVIDVEEPKLPKQNKSEETIEEQAFRNTFKI
jgi:phosphosulfolactate synthase (CoM biosynthesis protein A)